MKSATEVEVTDAMESLQSAGFCIPRDVIRRLAFERGSLKRKLKLCKEACIAHHSVDATDAIAAALVMWSDNEDGLDEDQLDKLCDATNAAREIIAAKGGD